MELDHSLLQDNQLSCQETVELTRTRSVYFSDQLGELPIVIDTGASVSLTPNRDDFVGNLHPTRINELQGLSSTTRVVGAGEIEWTVNDLFGSVRTIRTQAYYVPEATIRLFSPQVYFQESQAGQCLVTGKGTILTLSDGTPLEFPYNQGSNLPLMLSSQHNHAGMTAFDVAFMMKPRQLSALMSVVDEGNQNLTASQKELVKWHWRLGHANFQWIQRLAIGTDVEPKILTTKEPRVSSCPAPLCTACQLAKQNRRGAGTSLELPDPSKEMLLKRDILTPGQMVSIDQYISSVPGRLPDTYGKEPKTKQFIGGTLFVDHASGHIHLKNQVSLRIGETLKAKCGYERFASENGITLTTFRADNVPFGAAEFLADLEQKGQKISFLGTGAHHQNGVAERAIQTVTRWARAMLLHSVLHWPEQADLTLWPFALEHAVYLWNNIPNKVSRLAPIEVFTSMKFPSYSHLQHTHV